MTRKNTSNRQAEHPRNRNTKQELKIRMIGKLHREKPSMEKSYVF